MVELSKSAVWGLQGLEEGWWVGKAGDNKEDIQISLVLIFLFDSFPQRIVEASK